MSSIRIIIGGVVSSLFLIFLCISSNAERYYMELGLGKPSIKLVPKEDLALRDRKTIPETVVPIEEKHPLQKHPLKKHPIEQKTLAKVSTSLDVNNTQKTHPQETIILEEVALIKVENQTPLVKTTSSHPPVSEVEVKNSHTLVEEDSFVSNKIDDVKMIQEEISALLAHQHIGFKKNKGNINASGKKILDNIYHLLEGMNVFIEIQGHTDAGGKRKINQMISAVRAKRVKEYLIQKGLVASNIKAEGFGETTLLFPKKPYSRLNRRVEIYIKRKQ